jgi:CelD/BcsL family acetyltransferase involved in cellulose biosynthesis
MPIKSGLDPRRADDSPREVMLGMVIEEIMINRGVRAFDFLRGAQPRKFHWVDRWRETLRFEGWQRTPVAHALAALDRMAAERRLRRRFPGWLGMPPASVPAATSVLT